MEYIETKSAVNAVCITSASEALRAYEKCPLILALMMSFDKEGGEEFMFEKVNEPIFAVRNEWVVWNDSKVWIMTDKKFNKKYQSRSSIKYPNISWGGSITNTSAAPINLNYIAK